MKDEEFCLGEGLSWGTKLNEALTVNFGSCGVSDFACCWCTDSFCTDGGDVGE